MENEYTVYILYSREHDRLYIGYNSDYLERFRWHNELSTKGFSTRYRPWEIIHTEHFGTKSEAMAREKALKSGQGRQWIRQHLL